MPRGAHLRQFHFQPGESGNPNGRPTTDVSEKILTKYTRTHIADVLNKIMELTDAECADLLNDADGTQFEKVVAKVLLTARKNGDFSQIEKILDRCIGKVPQKIEGDPDKPIFASYTQIWNGAFKKAEKIDERGRIHNPA